MFPKINFKEFHYNKDGKKVAGTAHKIYEMTHPDLCVITQAPKDKLVDPFVFNPSVILK